jgi:hypothetical protein
VRYVASNKAETRGDGRFISEPRLIIKPRIHPNKNRFYVKFNRHSTVLDRP